MAKTKKAAVAKRHQWKYLQGGRKCDRCGAREVYKKRRSKMNSAKFVADTFHMRAGNLKPGNAPKCSG